MRTACPAIAPIASVERPLKIVHVSDFFFSAKIQSPSQFAVGGKLTNGLVRNGHQVIDISYRDVARAHNLLNSRKLGRSALARILKEFLASCRPDILLLGHGYMLRPEVIAEIRRQQPGMMIIQWNIDALFVPENARDFAERHAVVDASFISTAGSLPRHLVGGLGFVGFLPNPVDRSVERGRAFMQERGEADIFYACGNPNRERIINGKSWHMEEFCQTLEAALPAEMRFSYAGVRGRPYYSGADYAALLAGASMGLNISRRADYPLYSSDRFAHMIGNGQLVFMERQTGYDYFFGDHEIVFFENFKELAEKIRYFYKNPRERQEKAQAGWRHYHKLFSESRVADYLLRSSLGTLEPEEYPWRHDVMK